MKSEKYFLRYIFIAIQVKWSFHRRQDKQPGKRRILSMYIFGYITTHKTQAVMVNKIIPRPLLDNLTTDAIASLSVTKISTISLKFD